MSTNAAMWEGCKVNNHDGTECKLDQSLVTIISAITETAPSVVLLYVVFLLTFTLKSPRNILMTFYESYVGPFERILELIIDDFIPVLSESIIGNKLPIVEGSLPDAPLLNILTR